MYFDIKVGAITNAQRGARLLRYNGYKTAITRIDNPKPGDGCGFVLRVYTSEVESVLTILKNNGVRVMGVERS